MSQLEAKKKKKQAGGGGSFLSTWLCCLAMCWDSFSVAQKNQKLENWSLFFVHMKTRNVYVMPLFSICHARVENEQTLFKGSDAYLNYLTIHQL